VRLSRETVVHLELYVRYIPILGGLGLLAALAMYMYLKRQPVGTPRMREISGLIESGAMAFLRREYMVLAPVIVAVAVLLAWKVGLGIGIAFVFGGVCSVLAGFIGMKAATKCNVRTTEAARTHGQARALEIAFDGGAVMGLAVASLGLLGLGIVLDKMLDLGASGITPQQFTDFAETMSGFAMGASSIALFARVGGGIYTKAADVGADLVGKVEIGIPEDDPVTMSATSPAWAPISTRAMSTPSSPPSRSHRPVRWSPPSHASTRSPCRWRSRPRD
jgi:K(+)-stimulated pyrophosphate-energized sodium pump